MRSPHSGSAPLRKKTSPSLEVYRKLGRALVGSSPGLPMGPWETRLEGGWRRCKKGSCPEQVRMNPGWNVVSFWGEDGWASWRRSKSLSCCGHQGQAGWHLGGLEGRLEPDLHRSQNQQLFGRPWRACGQPKLFPVPVLAPMHTSASPSRLVGASISLVVASPIPWPDLSCYLLPEDASVLQE